MGLPQSGFKTPKGRVGLCDQAESLSRLALLDFQPAFSLGCPWPQLTSVTPIHLCQGSKAVTPTATRTLPVNTGCKTAEQFQWICDAANGRNTVPRWSIPKPPVSWKHTAALSFENRTGTTPSVSLLEDSHCLPKKGPQWVLRVLPVLKDSWT